MPVSSGSRYDESRHVPQSTPKCYPSVHPINRVRIMLHHVRGPVLTRSLGSWLLLQAHLPGLRGFLYFTNLPTELPVNELPVSVSPTQRATRCQNCVSLWQSHAAFTNRQIWSHVDASPSVYFPAGSFRADHPRSK